MIASCTGTAKLKIVETGELIEVSPSEVDWEQDGGDERQMGPELRYVAQIEFSSPATGKSYEASWQLWEYPIGVENHSETEVSKGIEILEDFAYGLSHEPEPE